MQRAASCRILAADAAFDSLVRGHFAEMAEHWSALAQSYQLAEEISGYIEWQARRLIRRGFTILPMTRS